MTPITLGQTVPNFTAAMQTSDGEQTFNLADFATKKLVIYFYPKDNTPGCTTESLDFNARLDVFHAENCAVIGVSKDSLRKHTNFIEKHQFRFPLIADVDETVCRLFDVIKLKKNFGKEYMGIERATFLLDEQGVLIHEWRKVRVNGHADEVLTIVKGVSA